MKKYFIFYSIALLFFCYVSVYSFELQNINFENVPINQVAIYNLELLNSSENDIELLKMEVIGGNNCFSVVDFYPIRLKQSQSVVYQIKFISNDNVTHNAFLRLMVRYKSAEYSLYSELKANAVHSNPYYSSTNNLRGLELLNVLKELVVGHKVLTYTEARTAMYASIDNFDGLVECVYSGRKVAATSIPNVNIDKFDTEHTWPQSVGANVEPPRSDIYHMRPTYQIANSRRGDHPFGYVVSNITYEDGGSRLGRDSNNRIVFEPREKVRGDVARGLFYFASRYGNIDNYIDYQEQSLRRFMIADPVDETELARGEAIFSYQNNRNPFIDYNQFAFRFNSFANPEFPKKSALVILDDTLFVLKQDGIELPLFVINIGDAPAFVSASIDGTNEEKHNYSIINNQSPLQIPASGKVELKIRYNYINENTNQDLPFVNFLLESGNIKRVYLKTKDVILSNQQEKVQEFDFSLYPNPVKHQTVISTSDIDKFNDLSITATTIDGRQFTIQYDYSNANQIVLNKTDIPCSNCMIYISLIFNGNRITKKLLVE